MHNRKKHSHIETEKNDNDQWIEINEYHQETESNQPSTSTAEQTKIIYVMPGPNKKFVSNIEKLNFLFFCKKNMLFNLGNH